MQQSSKPPIVALGSTRSHAHECACRLRGALLAAACLVGVAVAAGLFKNRFGVLPDPASEFADPVLLAFGFVALPGALQPLAAAALVVLAACVPRGAQPAWLCAALGSRALASLADLSYSIFLLHPLARPRSHPVTLRYAHSDHLQQYACSRSCAGPAPQPCRLHSGQARSASCTPLTDAPNLHVRDRSS